jgi:hypothetical protein
MLARSGRLPTNGAWAFEVKWDGFRAIVSTERELALDALRTTTRACGLRLSGGRGPEPLVGISLRR